MNEQIVLRFLEGQEHHQHLAPQQQCFQRQPWNVFLALPPWSIWSWWINQCLVLNIHNCNFPIIDIDSYIYDKTFFFSSPVCQTIKTTTPTRSSIGKGSKESRIDITPWQLWQIDLLDISGWTNHNQHFFYFAQLYTWRMKKSMKRSGWSVSEANTQRRSRATTFSPKTWRKNNLSDDQLVPNNSPEINFWVFYLAEPCNQDCWSLLVKLVGSVYLTIWFHIDLGIYVAIFFKKMAISPL